MQTAHSRAFTLIEILVVIAIIGIIASVGVVSLNNARTKGEIAAEQKQLRSIANAIEMYVNINRAYPPGTDVCSLCGYRSYAGVPPSWADPSTWELVADALYPNYLSEPIYYDTWGSYYAYDNNYHFPIWQAGLADGSRPAPSMLCSIGPNRTLETFLNNSTYPDPAQGDDICIFFNDND